MKQVFIKKFQQEQNELFIGWREFEVCIGCGTATTGVILAIGLVISFLIGLVNTAINHTLTTFIENNNLLTSNSWCIS
jgi:hypothetical protein